MWASTVRWEMTSPAAISLFIRCAAEADVLVEVGAREPGLAPFVGRHGGVAVRCRRIPAPKRRRADRLGPWVWGFGGEVAEFYAQFRRGSPAAVLDAVAAAFRLATDDVVVDLGCGTGSWRCHWPGGSARSSGWTRSRTCSCSRGGLRTQVA